jgi:uncharacterized protein YycO
MKPGDLILVRGNSFISAAIEDISNSIYSHVAGIVKENELIEAEGFRDIGYQALDYYKGKADVFVCDILTDEKREKIVEYVKNEIGGKYDYPLLFVEAARFLLHITFPYKEKFNCRICATLYVEAYRSVGIDLTPGIKYPSPGDVANSKLLRKVMSF